MGLYILEFPELIPGKIRVSVHDEDPGYLAWALLRSHGKRPVIRLDGVLQKRVVTADEAEGFVVRQVPTEDGQPQVDPSDPEKVWVEQVHGRVEIDVVEAG